MQYKCTATLVLPWELTFMGPISSLRSADRLFGQGQSRRTPEHAALCISRPPQARVAPGRLQSSEVRMDVTSGASSTGTAGRL